MTLTDFTLEALKGFASGFLSASVLGYFIQVLTSFLR